MAEMAHVFAASDDGPRARPELSEEQRGEFENLILLCSTCHTIVDKAPEVYPDKVILGWKREHANRIRAMFGVTHFNTRSKARDAIAPLLRENRAVFDDYGPYIEDAQNPESGAAERWKRKMLVKIIPNNRRILAHLDANTHLLREEEAVTLERFRQHVDDLEARHLGGFGEGASGFPTGMQNIAKD